MAPCTPISGLDTHNLLQSSTPQTCGSNQARVGGYDSPPSYSKTKRLNPVGPNRYLVGDFAQSIDAYRGAKGCKTVNSLSANGPFTLVVVNNNCSVQTTSVFDRVSGRKAWRGAQGCETVNSLSALGPVIFVVVIDKCLVQMTSSFDRVPGPKAWRGIKGCETVNSLTAHGPFNFVVVIAHGCHCVGC